MTTTAKALAETVEAHWPTFIHGKFLTVDCKCGLQARTPHGYAKHLAESQAAALQLAPKQPLARTNCPMCDCSNCEAVRTEDDPLYEAVNGTLKMHGLWEGDAHALAEGVVHLSNWMKFAESLHADLANLTDGV